MKEVYPKRGSEDSWAHILCALFFEEVQFRDPETSSGISHIESIPASKKVILVISSSGLSKACLGYCYQKM